MGRSGKKRGRLLRKVLMWTACVLALGCSGDPSDPGPVLARVDDYRLYLDEFQRQLAAELEYAPDAKLTQPVRERFLDGLIRKELLIQEARRRGLDREEAFVRAIERHWEATLIRNLLETKGREILERTLVGEEEVRARYARLQRETGDLPPLEELRDQVAALIREEKKSAMLDRWIAGLRENAEVTVDRSLLERP